MNPLLLLLYIISSFIQLLWMCYALFSNLSITMYAICTKLASMGLHLIVLLQLATKVLLSDFSTREFTEIYSSKFRISSYSHESFYNAQRAETLSRNSDVCMIRGQRCLQPYRRQGLNLLLGDRGVGEGGVVLLIVIIIFVGKRKERKKF